MDLQNFIPILDGIRSENPQAAENMFNDLLNNNKCLLLHLLILSITQISDIKTVKAAIILLQRAQVILSSEFLSLGNEEFHHSLQNSLLQFFQVTTITDPNSLKNLAHVISLFAGVYQQNWPNLYPTIILSLNSNSGPSMLIGVECLWKCIINGSIPIAQAFQTSFDFLNSIFSNSTNCDFQLILAGIRLAFIIYQSSNNIELASLSIQIINIYPRLPPEASEEYFREILYFANIDIIFFAPSMTVLFPLILNIIADDGTPSVSRNHCINLLTDILSDKRFSGLILPDYKKIYFLLISTISKSIAESAEFEFEEKSLTQQVSEDAVYTFSKVYSGTENIGYELIDIAETSVREGNPHLKCAYLIALKCVLSGCEEIFGDIGAIQEVLIAFIDASVFANEAVRFTAVKCLKKGLVIIGYYSNECNGEKIVPTLIQVIEQENHPIVFTAAIKCLAKYVSLFVDYRMYAQTVLYLIEKKITQMNIEQQIVAFRIYLSIFKKYPKEFNPFIEQIYGRMNHILGTTSFQNADEVNLFFESMKIAPSFVKVPGNVYADTAGKILLFITSVDISNFSSDQLDCVNHAIRQILKNCRQQFGLFAQKIVDITFKSAEKDIKFAFSNPYGCALKDDEQIASMTAKFNEQTKTYEYYSDNDIDSVNEPLTTLNMLLSEKELMAPHFIDILRIIMKILSEKISTNLIITTFSIVRNFIEYFDSSSPEGINLSYQLLFLMIKSFDIFDFNDSKDIETAFYKLKWVFIELSRSSANAEILQLILSLILKTFTITNGTRLMLFEQVQSDLTEEYAPLEDVENEITWFFPTIFQYYSNFYQPFQQTMENMFQLQLLKDKSISNCAICFWTSYCMFCPNCAPDKFNQILVFFKTVALNGLQEKQYANETIKKAFTAFMTLLSSERLSVDDTLNEIQFIANFLYAEGMFINKQNISAINNLILRPLLRIAAKLLTANQQQGSAQVIHMIFDVVLSQLFWISSEPCGYIAVMAFGVVAQSNHSMITGTEGIVIMYYIALLLYNSAETKESKRNLAMYVKALLQSDQISDIREIIKNKFEQKIQNQISKITAKIASKYQ